MKLLDGISWVFNPAKFVQAVTFNLDAIASVVGIASGVNSIMNSGSSAGGNTGGGQYYDPYKEQRPQWFQGLQTLMGNGGTQSTALSYADWLKQNPQTDSTGVSTTSSNGWVHLNNGSGSSRSAYNKYKEDFKPTTTGGGVQGAIDMVLNSPTYMGGYQSGQRTLNAGLARTGQTQSGAEQLALQGYGQDYFNQQYQNLYNQYTGLSKALDAPLNMSNQNQLNASQGQAGWGAIAQGVGGLGSIFSGSSNGTSNVSSGIQLGGSSSSWNPSSTMPSSWSNIGGGYV